jgi:hypothetical protein
MRSHIDPRDFKHLATVYPLLGSVLGSQFRVLFKGPPYAANHQSRSTMESDLASALEQFQLQRKDKIKHTKAVTPLTERLEIQPPYKFDILAYLPDDLRLELLSHVNTDDFKHLGKVYPWFESFLHSNFAALLKRHIPSWIPAAHIQESYTSKSNARLDKEFSWTAVGGPEFAPFSKESDHELQQLFLCTVDNWDFIFRRLRPLIQEGDSLDETGLPIDEGFAADLEHYNAPVCRRRPLVYGKLS